MLKSNRAIILYFLALIIIIIFWGCNRGSKSSSETKKQKLFSELDSNQKKDTSITKISEFVNSEILMLLSKTNIETMNLTFEVKQITILIDLINWYFNVEHDLESAGNKGPDKEELNVILKIFNKSLNDYNNEKTISNDIINLVKDWTNDNDIDRKTSFSSIMNNPTYRRFMNEVIAQYLELKGSKNPQEIVDTKYKNVDSLIMAILKNLGD
ncbi:MAG: hypothetical protein JST55_10670 [Bacteroidetes bacterium]|nr:hypothetical protein [Bacteroidota bacterium]